VVGEKKGKKKEKRKRKEVVHGWWGKKEKKKKKKKREVGDIQRNIGRWKRKMGKKDILGVEEIIKNK
jgi:hypothetical protein